jgi:signal transduction histidine kinase
MSGDLARRLLDVVDLIGANLEPTALLEQLSQSALELFGATGTCWCALEGDRVRIVTAAGLATDLVGLTYPVAGSALDELSESSSRSLVSRVHRFPHLNDRIYQSPDDQMAVALATVGGRPTGGLYVTLTSEHRFGAEELEVLELLASHVGVALHHVELYSAAEQARRENAAVLEAMADGVAVVCADGTVRTWNSAMATMTGCSAQDAVGGEAPFPLPEPGEVATLRSAAGRWLDVVVSCPAHGGDRVVSARDVTAAKELEAAQELFLATASHELRTPLTVLRGFGDTLLRHWDVLGDERRRELVGTMLARTEGMGELVEQILLASQAGLDGTAAAPQSFDLAATVAAAVAVLAGASDAHPVVLHADGPVPALGRPGTIAPILDQLVENAMKYSPDGGAVDVTVRRDAGGAVLTVADRGRGITEQDAERVFDRFYRGGVVAGGPSGAGLGLWIVRRTVEAQAGSVTAAPRAGGGTVIEVRLPA